MNPIIEKAICPKCKNDLHVFAFPMQGCTLTCFTCGLSWLVSPSNDSSPALEVSTVITRGAIEAEHHHSGLGTIEPNPKTSGHDYDKLTERNLR